MCGLQVPKQNLEGEIILARVLGTETFQNETTGLETVLVPGAQHRSGSSGRRQCLETPASTADVCSAKFSEISKSSGTEYRGKFLQCLSFLAATEQGK